MELLAVDREDREDCIVVRVKGDIDSGTVGELVSALTTALDEASTHPARMLVVDLQAVTFFGSAGLNAVLDCHHAGAAAGTSVRLVADNAQVIRTIEVTNLDRVLDVYPTLTEALRSSDSDQQR
ncbi:anti-sigma factor antagonist [Mycobacterium heckeshornense]|uniref:Anti-sigma factor antagonist n=1 Tax=Mycobacterium heckeshornense TaxID=110505 RepID=A0A2G8BJN9_9MYCO|nr:STAS domain-containing protein [Mycobacterium heckeshornense]KMV24404.1 anti-sigma factor antagonist [Mycobacterium heckeshornense]MCV7035462.1 STAS domain-containing protein [Mycobacterium heckeshornense]PIJ37965.1 anti-sigma factor antagonist [Mycobacterium heckeshornense]BCO37944.1 anti-anti-sigma factor [Mycobacterium heckeshornense]BCQ10808.1 anti-anti-sigma factor [Mycobacterium heckeshornense]